MLISGLTEEPGDALLDALRLLRAAVAKDLGCADDDLEAENTGLALASQHEPPRRAVSGPGSSTQRPRMPPPPSPVKMRPAAAATAPGSPPPAKKPCHKKRPETGDNDDDDSGGVSATGAASAAANGVGKQDESLVERRGDRAAHRSSARQRDDGFDAAQLEVCLLC